MFAKNISAPLRGVFVWSMHYGGSGVECDGFACFDMGEVRQYDMLRMKPPKSASSSSRESPYTC